MKQCCFKKKRVSHYTLNISHTHTPYSTTFDQGGIKQNIEYLKQTSLSSLLVALSLLLGENSTLLLRLLWCGSVTSLWEGAI